MEVQRAIVKRNIKFKKSRRNSNFLADLKTARKAVSSLVATKKRQYYNNKIMHTISTKGNIFKYINELTGNRIFNKQISLRTEGNVTVDDGESIANLFNEYFTGNKLEQPEPTLRKLQFFTNCEVNVSFSSG